MTERDLGLELGHLDAEPRVDISHMGERSRQQRHHCVCNEATRSVPETSSAGRAGAASALDQHLRLCGEAHAANDGLEQLHPGLSFEGCELLGDCWETAEGTPGRHR